MKLPALALAGLVSLTSISAASCIGPIPEAAARHGVPPPLLAAIAATESGHAGRPHPWALNITGEGSIYPPSRADALRLLQAAVHAGRAVDVGCMQISTRYHRDRFRSLAEMLEPAVNIDYAASLLRSERRRHGSWAEAVGAYHAGPTQRNTTRARAYRCRVAEKLTADRRC